MNQQKDNFLATLEQFESRYNQIENEIAKSASSGNTSLLVALSKEQGKLRDIVAKYREYKKITSEIDDAEQIIADDTVEADFKTLAKEEKEQLEPKRQNLLEEIKNTLVMAEDTAIDSVIMEIRAGTGGDEAALFARDLYEMYIKSSQLVSFLK